MRRACCALLSVCLWGAAHSLQCGSALSGVRATPITERSRGVCGFAPRRQTSQARWSSRLNDLNSRWAGLRQPWKAYGALPVTTKVLVTIKVVVFAIQAAGAATGKGGSPLAALTDSRALLGGAAGDLAVHPMTTVFLQVNALHFVLDLLLLAWVGARVERFAGVGMINLLFTASMAAVALMLPQLATGPVGKGSIIRYIAMAPVDRRYPFGVGAADLTAAFLGFLVKMNVAATDTFVRGIKPFLPAMGLLGVAVILAGAGCGMAVGTTAGSVGSMAARLSIVCFLSGALVGALCGPRYKAQKWRRNKYKSRTKGRLPMLLVWILCFCAPGMLDYYAAALRIILLLGTDILARTMNGAAAVAVGGSQLLMRGLSP